MTDFVDPLEEPLGLDARGGRPDQYEDEVWEVAEDSPEADAREADGRAGGAIDRGDGDNALEVDGRDST